MGNQTQRRKPYFTRAIATPYFTPQGWGY